MFDKYKTEIIPIPFSTGNYRGYIATFKIENQLFEITAEKFSVEINDQLFEMKDGKFSIKVGSVSLKSILNNAFQKLKTAIITTPSGPGQFSPAVGAAADADLRFGRYRQGGVFRRQSAARG